MLIDVDNVINSSKSKNNDDTVSVVSISGDDGTDKDFEANDDEGHSSSGEETEAKKKKPTISVIFN
jgi:hypothetical protein